MKSISHSPAERCRGGRRERQCSGLLTGTDQGDELFANLCRLFAASGLRAQIDAAGNLARSLLHWIWRTVRPIQLTYDAAEG